MGQMMAHAGHVTICFTQIDETTTRISYAGHADVALEMLTYTP